jgi:Family of unknown function (DUF6325)
MNDDLEEMGPIDWILVEFSGPPSGAAAPHLLDLVERGLIRILDLVIVNKDEDGAITLMEVTDLDGDGALDLAVFEGARSGILGDDDANEAAEAMEAGTSAVLLLYENRWAAPFAAAVRRSGGQLVANGRIPVQAILAALDAAEGAEAAATKP